MPMDIPSSKNSTLVIVPSVSVAFAVIVVASPDLSLASLLGDVISTTGGLFPESIKEGIENSPLNEIQLFPNPVEDELVLSPSSNIKSVRIYSTTGECVLDTTNEHMNSLTVSHLKSGLYLCHIQTPFGETKQLKFIKK